MISRLLVWALILCALNLKAQTSDASTNKRVKIPNMTTSQMAVLANAGIDLHCGVHQDSSGIILELTPYEQEIVQSLGVNTQVLIDDLSTFYSNRVLADIENAKATLSAMKARVPEDQQQRSSV